MSIRRCNHRQGSLTVTTHERGISRTKSKQARNPPTSYPEGEHVDLQKYPSSSEGRLCSLMHKLRPGIADVFSVHTQFAQIPRRHQRNPEVVLRPDAVETRLRFCTSKIPGTRFPAACPGHARVTTALLAVPDRLAKLPASLHTASIKSGDTPEAICRLLSPDRNFFGTNTFQRTAVMPGSVCVLAVVREPYFFDTDTANTSSRR